MNWSDGAARVIAGRWAGQLCAGRLRSGAVLPSQFRRPASCLTGPQSAPAAPQQLAGGGPALSGSRRGTVAIRSGHRVVLTYGNAEELR